MTFNFTIENLGNIEKADIEVKQFTLIAGENGSGKSFATKSIYSILDALNKDYITKELIETVSFIKKEFAIFEEKLTNKASVDIEFIEKYHQNYEPFLLAVLEAYQMSDLRSQAQLSKNYEKNYNEIISEIQKYQTQRGNLKKFINIKAHIDSFAKLFVKINQIITEHKNVVVEGIEKNLKDNLKKNFQITDLKPIIHKKSKQIKFYINTIGNITIDGKEVLDFSFSSDGIVEIQELQNIVFIDSPVYLKIRKGLEKNESFKFHPFFKESDRYLKGYPLYLERLYEFIDKKYIDEPDFKSLSDELQELIKGKLSVTKSGDIEYVNEQGINIPLSLTAMGISNIGLIDLLLRNNIINKGSFLIIDEPEAHLHPKWQVALVEILYKVAKSGANIIIATHSIDMIKTVELILKKEENAKDLISINKMPFNSEFKSLNNEEKIEEILTDLSSPFYELYLQGLV